MSCIANIQNYSQEYAETIAEILEVDVTIVDKDCIRISGTGPHKKDIGKPVPHGSFFQEILKSGKPGFINDTKREFECQKCARANICKELATMGYPLFVHGEPVGIIGIMAFSEEQKEKLLYFLPKLWNFLKHMSSLLESKIILMENNKILRYQVQEAVGNINKTYSFESIIGKNKQFLSLIDKAKQIAPSISTVLIRGESGTGKEVLARAIHSNSNRVKNSFVTVNCASIPENLLESELFGYESGAFTGANKDGKIGKFELAQKGTIFLDEIGDMSLALQPKLLRVLQEKTIDRIGGKKPIPVDVRIIAATHRDLETMVKQGRFREDLYYRLNVIPLNLLPLRERKDDIPFLIDYFLDKYCRIMRKRKLKVDPSVEKVLMNFDWPGNIRQLENIIEYLINMVSGEVIKLEDIPDHIRDKGIEYETKNKQYLSDMLAVYEKRILKQYLKYGASTDDKIKIAKELGISIATLYRKIEKYELE